MLDPFIRISAVVLTSCLGWVTMSPAQQPEYATPVQHAPVVLAGPRQEPQQDLSDRYDLDPFYVPEFVAPGPRTRIVWARVTACSPKDPKDLDYYAKHGYAGAPYNIAADYRVFPKGTRIRVPGYMEQSYPGRFWVVDAPGGSVIRRSTAEGVPHIDVKFTTLYSVKQWGRKWIPLEVQDP